jgi:hypothetical protein
MTFREARDHRPIIHDSAFPVGWSRDRRRGDASGGEGEGDRSAMDGRVLDHGPSELAKMFPDAPNPSARNFR